MGGHGASYLGPEHDGVQLSVDPVNPLPFARPDELTVLVDPKDGRHVEDVV